MRWRWRAETSVWPAEWKVFLYTEGGLPREAMKRGRKLIRGYSQYF